VIPDEVKLEIVDEGKIRGKPDAYMIEREINLGKINIESTITNLNFNLGKGETGVINLALAEKMENPVICIDDLKAEKIAFNLNLNVISCDILLLQFFKMKLITRKECEDYLTKLAQIAGYTATRTIKNIQILDLLDKM
jgi:predicted nucleic acid-binding protein